MSDSTDSICIAILLTCFNRKQKTLSCLKGLHDALLPGGAQLEVILLDDGSTDGTGDAVSDNYPDVTILKGSGDLYWNQGMRVAWTEAVSRKKYDYYLLLNDDTELFHNAIKVLVETENIIRNKTGNAAIIVGSVEDPDTGRITYGGVTREKAYIGIKFSLVEPESAPRLCDTFNGNCVLISKEIVDKVGILSKCFTHALGDTDYGLRAAEKGFQSYIVPGFVGYCKNNSATNTWVDPNLTLEQRKALLYSPLGKPPKEWLYFVRRHAGIVWMLSWLQLYMRLYFPKLWRLLRKLRGRSDN